MVERERKIHEEKKQRGETRGGKEERTRSRHPSSPSPPPPPRFRGVQFNSLPTDRRALLYESLEQATITDLSLPERMMESVDEILLCDHSNETS